MRLSRWCRFVCRCAVSGTGTDGTELATWSGTSATDKAATSTSEKLTVDFTSNAVDHRSDAFYAKWYCGRTCGAGTYSSDRAGGGVTCQWCQVGKYRAEIAHTHTSCIACPSDKTTSGTGATSLSSCVDIYGCPKGQYGANSSKASASTCTSCPANTYQPETGQTNCTACLAGTGFGGTGATSVSQCLPACSTCTISEVQAGTCSSGHAYSGSVCQASNPPASS
eukprot:COSAG05_NODE_5696_length_1114_cov_0.944828_2_plen_223_part_01